jgi:hypothetical protein
MRACNGARGTLWSKWSPEKEKNKLVRRRRRKMPEKTRREETYPEAIGLCFFGRGTPIFCLFIVWTGSGWGLTPRFRPTHAPVGGPWFKGAASTTSSSEITEDGIVGKA